MSQDAIFKYLSEGDFKTVQEVSDNLNIRYIDACRKINRLYAYGFLDVKIKKGKGTRYVRRTFRVKKDCIR